MCHGKVLYFFKLCIGVNIIYLYNFELRLIKLSFNHKRGKLRTLTNSTLFFRLFSWNLFSVHQYDVLDSENFMILNWKKKKKSATQSRNFLNTDCYLVKVNATFLIKFKILFSIVSTVKMLILMKFRSRTSVFLSGYFNLLG